MARARQRDFFEADRAYGPRRDVHGGSLALGRRKLKRPLDRRRPSHWVFKSSHAKGDWSLLTYRNRLFVERTFVKWAARFRVTLHERVNVGNHVHLVLSFKSLAELKAFVRTVSGLIARHVTRAKKGQASGKRFWDTIPFSRVVRGRGALRILRVYMEKNRSEARSGVRVSQDETARFSTVVRNSRAGAKTACS